MGLAHGNIYYFKNCFSWCWYYHKKYDRNPFEDINSTCKHLIQLKLYVVDNATKKLKHESIYNSKTRKFHVLKFSEMILTAV